MAKNKITIAAAISLAILALALLTLRILLWRGGSKILIVMVRYLALLQAKTIRTLGDCFAEDTTLMRNFSILAWDNAPTGQPVPGLPFHKRWRLEEWRSAVSAKRWAAAGDVRP